ncbi:MAG TPA: M56 family metallopeptidase [Terracidiphilus sp.]|nr:M56 family metallopeptidase [Terracidiphilus sp.]
MSGFESALVSYVLNSLWQAPLVFAAAWIGARGLRAAGPAAEHRVWVSALVLESALPALSILPWEKMHFVWPWFAHQASAPDGQVSVRMGVGAGDGFAALRLPPGVMGALAIVYAAATGYFIARFVWRCVRLSLLRRGAEPLRLSGEAALSFERWLKRMGIAGPVAIVGSKEIFAPVTMGIVHGRVMLPAGMITHMPQTDLDTAIAHEFAHIRRKDFLKNLAYEIAALPLSYHPCLWVTRQFMTETREMVCDEMAAGISGSEEYAQSLLRLAALLLQGRAVRVPHAIGIFDANTLERRLMKLTEKKRQMGALRATVWVVACVALGVVTAASAVALRVGVDPQASADKQDSKNGAPHSVLPEKMQANLISKVAPKYPPEAKTARIQGTVVLDAVIGKTGHVENLRVASGPSELLQSSLDAVRQWRYKPFLLNGKPIEVKTTISVVYSLEK